MTGIFKKFANDEFGNAVLDWGVLACGALMLAGAIALTIIDPAYDLVQEQAPGMEHENSVLAGDGHRRT